MLDSQPSKAPPSHTVLLGTQKLQPSLLHLSSHSNSHTSSEGPATDEQSTNTATKSLQKGWKEGKDATMIDTMNLAMQHFHYLILKDPFTNKTQQQLLAKEAFSCAFGDKEDCQFIVKPDMLQTVSKTVESFHSD